MNKLEECLELMDVIEKNPNNLLSDKVQELLKENDFYSFKEKLGIKFYRDRDKGNEMLIKYGIKYRGGCKKGNYCFAILKENSDEACHDFCKRFERYVDHEFLGLAFFFGPFSAGTLGLTYIGLSSGIDPVVTVLSSFIISGVLAASIGDILEGCFTLVYEVKMEESCKELYYGKEALEKAFRGKR